MATPRVIRLVGSASSFEQRCVIAVLDAEDAAVVSHLTAAALWGLPGFHPDEIHVSRVHSATHRSSTVATIHHPRSLPVHHRTLLDGVPVTTMARTVFDLAGLVHPLRAERALDNALSRKLVPLENLRAVAIELFEHGRTGSALMRCLLEERGAGYIPCASGLEARFLALVVEGGLELPERQVDLGGDEWIGRVDFYFRRVRLVVEVDGEAFHSAKLDRESDARRDAALGAARFRVLRISEKELLETPHLVVARLRSALLQSSGG